MRVGLCPRIEGISHSGIGLGVVVESVPERFAGGQRTVAPNHALPKTPKVANGPIRRPCRIASSCLSKPPKSEILPSVASRDPEYFRRRCAADRSSGCSGGRGGDVKKMGKFSRKVQISLSLIGVAVSPSDGIFENSHSEADGRGLVIALAR